MTDRPEDDLSPSLGGDRATEEPPEAPPRQEEPAASDAGQPDLEALFAELGGSELNEILRRFGPLLGGGRGGALPDAPDLNEILRRLGPLLGGLGDDRATGERPGAAPRQERPFASGDGQPDLEAFSQEVEAIMEDTFRAIEERLPPTLAAFEGMFSALGQVFQPLFEEPDDPSDRQP